MAIFRRWLEFRVCKTNLIEAYSLYVAQSIDSINEEGGPFGRAVSKMVQIRGEQGGGAEAYSLYAAQADDAANEEDEPFLEPLGETSYGGTVP